MKTKFTWIIFILPIFLYAQFDCDPQFFSPNGNMINLSPEMFSYYENPNGNDPLGDSGVGNLANEQEELSAVIFGGSTTYPGGPDNVWNDFNYVGILDLGTETDLTMIYLAVGPETNPNGIIRITAGKIGSPEYNENDILVETNFQFQECARVYEFDLSNLQGAAQDANLATRYLTIERIQALETVTEMAILGAETPPNQIEISGCVNTECGNPIPGATVQLLEFPIQGPPVELVQTTNENGCYSFSNLNSGSNYFTGVFKDGQTTCGLDVYDRIAIQNHINGDPLIESPYQLLAADVNNDQTVDSEDYEYLSAMFVNDGNTDFPIDWKFVSTDIIFPDPTDPYNLATGSRSYQPLTSSQFNQDFIGVKTGDVACSYTDACPIEGISLSGCARTSCGEPVPGAEVELIEVFYDGTISATLTDFAITNEEGYYEFFRRTAGSQYIVTIAKADQIDCGVDEDDFRIMQEHILLINQIEDPLELLAADLTADDIINTADLVYASFLLINQYEAFLQGGGIAWTFIREGHIFSDPSDPYADLPLNSYDLATYNSNQSALNFTAIKNGDLNCSYSSDCTTGNPEDGNAGNDEGGEGGEGGRRFELDASIDLQVEKMTAQAQPNPFKETTNLMLELHQDGPVTIRIYNTLGKEIFTEEQILDAGIHHISLDRIPKTASGILPYVIEQNGNIISGRLIKID